MYGRSAIVSLLALLAKNLTKRPRVICQNFVLQTIQSLQTLTLTVCGIDKKIIPSASHQINFLLKVNNRQVFILFLQPLVFIYVLHDSSMKLFRIKRFRLFFFHVEKLIIF